MKELRINMEDHDGLRWKKFLRRKYADMVKEAADRFESFPKTQFARLLGAPNSTVSTWLDIDVPLDSVDWKYIRRAYQLWGDEFITEMGLAEKELSRA